MEATGFEPVSEDNATQVSTGIVTVLLSPSGPPVTGSPSGQPGCPLPSAAGGGWTAQPAKVEPLFQHADDAEKEHAGRWLGCQSVGVLFVASYFGPALLKRTRPRYPLLVLELSPSNPKRPRVQKDANSTPSVTGLVPHWLL